MCTPSLASRAVRERHTVSASGLRPQQAMAPTAHQLCSPSSPLVRCCDTRGRGRERAPCHANGLLDGLCGDGCPPLLLDYFVCVSCLSLAGEVDVKPVDCNTLQVNYTVNPLPDGGNEVSLQSLVVKYRPILETDNTMTRTVPLNGNPAEGVLCLSGLTPNTGYRVTYNVQVNASVSTLLPPDSADPEEESTESNCGQPGKCIETNSNG